MKRPLGLVGSFDSLAAAGKTRALAEPDASSAELISFLDFGAHANIPQQVRPSLHGAASGVKGYVVFCRLINVTPFPPLAIYFVRWTALFSTGRTFCLHVSHFEKACAFLGLGVNWRTPAVNSVIAGLDNAPNSRAEPSKLL